MKFDSETIVYAQLCIVFVQWQWNWYNQKNGDGDDDDMTFKILSFISFNPPEKDTEKWMIFLLFFTTETTTGNQKRLRKIENLTVWKMFVFFFCFSTKCFYFLFFFFGDKMCQKQSFFFRLSFTQWKIKLHCIKLWRNL